MLGTPFDGTDMHILTFKLKNLKTLKSGTIMCLAILKRNILLTEQNLADGENLFESSPSSTDRENLHKIQADHLTHLKNEDIFWR